MLAIIDYGSGNLRSVAKSFERVSEGKIDIRITSNPESLDRASHIVLPGVGAFADCMQGLKNVPGMLQSLENAVKNRGVLFLGICVGMQMLFKKGHEHGTHEGLGWLDGEVLPLKPHDRNLKVPHMGWNELQLSVNHPFLRHIKSGDHAYFVHSYHAECRKGSDVIATTHYGHSITAAVAQGNIMGVQFHPEKSQKTGLTLLENFMGM